MISMQEYQGSLFSPTDKRVKTANECYRNQVARCNNQKNPRYKDNGAKGIRVYYTARQFVAWYLDEIEKYTGTQPSVGRIDHSKGYSFDNIRIESLADNSHERIERVGPTRSRVSVDIYKNGVFLQTAESLKSAAKVTGVQASHITKYCRGILKNSYTGYSFKFPKVENESAA